ncbi:hypothetical protein [Hymenobacter psychrophilus]|uniref:hypothetical protein n=1 Tax=Hymenobacter psychrophilus TaxID=651662 RepID=UPI001114A2CA|nr:hypothetical protein [Hymenobacter psychrophilus]
MLQPKNQLMKRGTQRDWEPRVDRKVFGSVGFPDSAAGISVVFSGYCPATVSDSETVFLCPVSSRIVQQTLGLWPPLPWLASLISGFGLTASKCISVNYENY